MKRCKRCGSIYPAGDKKCPSCGRRNLCCAVITFREKAKIVSPTIREHTDQKTEIKLLCFLFVVIGFPLYVIIKLCQEHDGHKRR